MPKLTEKQMEYFLSKMVPANKVAAWATPVRFQIDGHTLNICTGELQRKSIRIINQIHYFNLTKRDAQKIAKILKARAVFSE